MLLYMELFIHSRYILLFNVSKSIQSSELTNFLLILEKPLNYFEKLELENSWPNPISTKKRYQERMNQIAQEMGIDSDFMQKQDEKKMKKKLKKKRWGKKAEKKPLTE